MGKVAIANGKLTYQAYERIFSGPRWQTLAAKGAQTQRVLWASTHEESQVSRRHVRRGTDRPGHRQHNSAGHSGRFRDHGKLRKSLRRRRRCQETMDDLAKSGISMKQVTDQLTDEGVKLLPMRSTSFSAPWKKHQARPAESKPANYVLPADLDNAVKTTLDDWRANGKVRRLWDRDATL
jgi:transaldolase/glucose-6-phosphate isomerase